MGMSWRFHGTFNGTIAWGLNVGNFQGIPADLSGYVMGIQIGESRQNIVGYS